jgi:hypothetical protein
MPSKPRGYPAWRDLEKEVAGVMTCKEIAGFFTRPPEHVKKMRSSLHVFAIIRNWGISFGRLRKQAQEMPTFWGYDIDPLPSKARKLWLMQPGENNRLHFQRPCSLTRKKLNEKVAMGLIRILLKWLV